MPEPTALAHLLVELAKRPRLGVDGDRQVSGIDFQQRVGAWHECLDLPAGQRIALAHGSGIEFAAALYAAWMRGLEVVVPGDVLPATLEQMRHSTVRLVGDFGAATDLGTPLAAGPAIDAPLPPTGPNPLWLSTSGSSGMPVQIGKSVAQLDAEIAALEQTFGAQLGDCRIASTVSHQHIYGLLFRLLWPLASGRTIEALAHPYLETVALTLARESLALVASPAHLKRLPAGLPWQAPGCDLRAVFSSGGPLSHESARAVSEATGMTPIEVYGSTETGGIAWRRQVAGDCAFQPLPGVELAQREDGTLALRSPHLPDLQWRSLTDHGQWSATSGLRLGARADRIVKIEEKRVSLNAIEAAACGEWLSSARVVTLDGRRTQLGLVGIPTAAARELLLQAGRRGVAQHLRTQLMASCELVALPRRLRLLGEWPQNSQGKTPDSILRELFADTESRPMLPFHDWIERAAGMAIAELWIAPDLYHFQGHFPGQPILPGVVQIEWAIALARGVFPLPTRLERMETLKFQALIQPGMRLRLDLGWKPERCQLEFRVSSGSGAHASGRLVFADD